MDIRELMGDLAITMSIDPFLFSQLKEGAFEIILTDHYQDYTEHATYKDYLHKKAQKEAKAMKFKTQGGGYYGDPESSRRELKEMLSSPLTSRLQHHLMNVGDVNNLFFWIEVEDFTRIPFTQQTYVQGRAQKVSTTVTLWWWWW